MVFKGIGMIARLSGTLAYKSIAYVIVDVQGIGYQVFVPLTTFYELPDLGQPVTLHIHTQVKEDGINLFGFRRGEERELFQAMIAVSGIGPRLAINILSGVSVEEFIGAVVKGDLRRLTGIPGVGRKTGERLMLELKDKVLKLGLDRQAAPAGTGGRGQSEVEEDALSALVNLG
ncbi:MAG: Holliday junction branch migration protein RuvA, partial [Syntrophales bacterium]|nr:Holliday junction branch migration protein RuvA [Syntrophales bacterium]